MYTVETVYSFGGHSLMYQDSISIYFTFDGGAVFYPLNSNIQLNIIFVIIFCSIIDVSLYSVDFCSYLASSTKMSKHGQHQCVPRVGKQKDD